MQCEYTDSQRYYVRTLLLLVLDYMFGISCIRIHEYAKTHIRPIHSILLKGEMKCILHIYFGNRRISFILAYNV